MSKMGWFGVVRGQPRSLEIAPFDRASAYEFLLAFYIAQFLGYSEISRKSPLATPLFT